MKQNKEFKYGNFLAPAKKVEVAAAALYKRFREATKKEDIYEHWDIQSHPNLMMAIPWHIDVKGMRKIARNGEDKDENIYWIEIKNVQGKTGSAYAEKMDALQFEMKDYFIIVLKEDLHELIKEKVKKIYVEKPEDALYKLYKRKGRKDILTLVKTVDLIYI